MNDRAPSFDLGLVLAGAVSAGAYTAGVVDFLIEALDQWQRARATDHTVPRHDVRIRVMSGASAGGIVAGLSAAALSELPAAAPASPSRPAFLGRLYGTWVDDVDVTQLLDTADLSGQARVQSLLDSSALSAVARKNLAFNPGGGLALRRYVADPLELILTVTNLRGVPYRISFEGDARSGYPMTMHADSMRFALARRDPRVPDTRWLNAEDAAHPGWQVLQTAALATSAFPVGLAPRRLQRRVAEYDDRQWRVPVMQPRGEEHECFELRPIPPDDALRDPYEFWAVDGGLMDNEPLELARRTLSGGGSNPREPDRATRAVILIDPFPAAAPETSPGDLDVVGALTGMLGALIEQARFKPEELTLAQDESVYSRFLVAPASAPLASAPLGGFAGFLSRRFRHHDFQLGRRNCQKFLMSHLAVPLEAAAANPVLRANDDAIRKAFAFEDDGGRYFPLIPLLGSARDTVPLVAWDTLPLTGNEARRIEDLLDRRIGAVESALVSGYVKGAIARAGLKLAARLSRGHLRRAAMQRVATELTARGLWAV